MATDSPARKCNQMRLLRPLYRKRIVRGILAEPLRILAAQMQRFVEDPELWHSAVHSFS